MPRHNGNARPVEEAGGVGWFETVLVRQVPVPLRPRHEDHGAGPETAGLNEPPAGRVLVGKS